MTRTRLAVAFAAGALALAAAAWLTLDRTLRRIWCDL